MVKEIGAVMVAAGVIFCGGENLEQWLHNWRTRRYECRRCKLHEAYKKRFAVGQREINEWRAETEPEIKRQNIICKNPAYAAVWRV